MMVIHIDKKDWVSAVDALRGSYRLFGPVKDNKTHVLKELEKGEQPDLEYSNTRLSPKSVVYPQSQVMFEYSLDEKDPDHHRMKEVATDSSARAILGIRPCDADAFLLVKRNFDTPDYKDPYWIRAYESTTMVGLACKKPCSTCFCTSAGSGPFSETGLDVLLVDEGDSYLAKAVTEKGEALLNAAGLTRKADADAEERIAARKTEVEATISSTVSTERIKDQFSNDLYAAPFWDEVAFSCLNCGTCTYVCPTCWCFDIQDENRGNHGVRMRNWDSCMFPLFTLHGTGHNPRGEKVQRVRQRFMHKLKYYVDKYGDGIQCVGCGRCVRSCPVNIDIRKVCDLMNSFGPDSCACSAS